MTTRTTPSAAPRPFSDEVIATAAARAIQMDRGIPGGVHVDVDHGTATLTGTVHFAYQREEAEDIVRHVDGVRQVVNRLDVHGGVEAPDECC
jgi:osmotically-inducible protein OsmY